MSVVAFSCLSHIRRWHNNVLAPGPLPHEFGNREAQAHEAIKFLLKMLDENEVHPRVHYLSCPSVTFAEIRANRRTFDVRLDDRNYQVADVLVFQEVTLENTFTGDDVSRKVKRVWRDLPGITDGHVLLELEF